MSAIIDSAPNCITHASGAVKGDDADFILQATYAKCQGIMTFGHGTVYGDGGSAATSQYYILAVVGIIVTIVALVAWVAFEQSRFDVFANRKAGGADGIAPASSRPPSPSGV